MLILSRSTFQALFQAILQFIHIHKCLSSEKQRYGVLLKLLEPLLVIDVLVSEFEYLIRHLLCGAGPLNACLLEFLWLVQVVLKELGLASDEIGVGRVLGEPVIQTI